MISPISLGSKRRGFTLIELIIVIAIIAIIVAAVFVAMDPVRRLNTSRNARRGQDTTGIAQAITLGNTDGTSFDFESVLKAAEGSAIDTTLGCTGSDGCVGDWFKIGGAQAPASSPYVSNPSGTDCDAITTCGGTVAADQVATRAGCLNLSDLVTKKLIPKVPSDPKFGTANEAGYAIKYDGGAYLVRACQSEPEGSGGTGNAPLVQSQR